LRKLNVMLTLSFDLNYRELGMRMNQKNNAMLTHLTFVLTIALLFVSTTAIGGTMNKCVDPDGRIEFTDRPCATGAPSNVAPHNRSETSDPKKAAQSSISLETPVVHSRLERLPGHNMAANGGEISAKFGVATLSTISTLAGSAEQDGDVDGIGQAARFRNPTGLTSDGKNLYITEAGNNTIRKVELATGKVTTLAGSAGMRGSKDGLGSDARFNSPHGITNDGKNLYVADHVNHSIRKIVISTGEVTTLAGNPATTGRSDGIGKEAQFAFPEDVTTDGANLYVTDPNSSTIRKIEIATGKVTTFAGRTVIDSTLGLITGSVDGKGQAARFGNPTGITNDGRNLYVSDQYNHNIRKIVISTGEVTTLAGPVEATCAAGWKGRCPSGYADGIGSNARFSYPEYIATDGTYLYVTASNNTIRRIAIATGEVTTLISGEAGATIGTVIAYQLKKAWGIFVSDDHSVYVTDRTAHAIYKLQ